MSETQLSKIKFQMCLFIRGEWHNTHGNERLGSKTNCAYTVCPGPEDFPSGRFRLAFLGLGGAAGVLVGQLTQYGSLAVVSK